MARRTGYRRSKDKGRGAVRRRQETGPSGPEQFLRNLGQIIRHTRRQKKMTQVDLSKLATVNAKYLGEVELGKVNPTVLLLLKVTGALGLEITDVFPGSQSHREQDVLLHGEIMGFVRRLGPLNLQKLHKILKVILE